MWLIDTSTLELHGFTDHRSPPPYAILSHCGGQDEVSFKDFRKKQNCDGPGFLKVLDACAFARQYEWRAKDMHGDTVVHDGFGWLWADTCCIDKRSSSELTEAINSMYAWYQNAHICFAYLADFDLQGRDIEVSGVEEFKRSRWFTRGWTLQELLGQDATTMIAPPCSKRMEHSSKSLPLPNQRLRWTSVLTRGIVRPSQVVFVDVHWQCIGAKREEGIHNLRIWPVLAEAIESTTGVPARLLTNLRPLQSFSVAQRLSWASRRSTTREEDMAYCLFGLFSINMPLLYGEGGSKAFRRLQHEILRRELGKSIFAWRTSDHHPTKSHQLFASSPALFAGCADVVDVARRSGPIFSSRGHWIELRAPAPPQKTVYEDATDPRFSCMKELMIRLACGRWKTVSESRVFVPCVLLLTPMLGSQHLLRVRGIGDHDYFDEDDLQGFDHWAPAVIERIRYIPMHSNEAEPMRWAAGTIDIEHTTFMQSARGPRVEVCEVEAEAPWIDVVIPTADTEKRARNEDQKEAPET